MSAPKRIIWSTTVRGTTWDEIKRLAENAFESFFGRLPIPGELEFNIQPYRGTRDPLVRWWEADVAMWAEGAPDEE